jgi:hypothetical protein
LYSSESPFTVFAKKSERAKFLQTFLMRNLRSAAKWCLKLWICIFAFQAVAVIGQAEEPPEIKRAPAVNETYVFKPVAITPSPDGEGYLGRFQFINKGVSPLMVNGFHKPARGKFEPRFIRYQTLTGGKWNDLEMGYCSTGAQEFPMKPLASYEFHADLYAFDEQDTPLTGRIGFDVDAGEDVGWVEYWSYPFVLDWKKDRESGEFASAKKEHYNKLRAAFSKAGFKDELLVGDDFCSQVLQSMMKEAHGPVGEASFKPFVGKLKVIPFFQLDGSIRIDFTSDEVHNLRTEYRGWFRLDPRKFNPQWFHKATKNHVEVSEWGDGGIEMELDDGTSWDSPLYLCINYVPFDKSKSLTVKESVAPFTRMLDALGKCLKD